MGRCQWEETHMLGPQRIQEFLGLLTPDLCSGGLGPCTWQQLLGCVAETQDRTDASKLSHRRGSREVSGWGMKAFRGACPRHIVAA